MSSISAFALFFLFSPIYLHMASESRPTLFPVLLVNFIGMLGYSIILPFLVFLVEKFGGNEFVYGLLGSVYPAFQLLGAPLLGRWSDQVGRRMVLLISQLGTFLAWMLFVVALTLPRQELLEVRSDLFGTFLITLPLLLLFAARALDGITGGNVSVANAYLSDISTDANRKANFGKMASSTSLGFIVGPMLAGLLSTTRYEELLPVLAAAAISLLAIYVIHRYLPESVQRPVPPDLRSFSIRRMWQAEHKECYNMERCPAGTSLQDVLQLPYIPLLFGIYFVTFLGWSFFYAGFPVFASRYLHWESGQLGLFFTVSSLIMVLVQGPVLSYLSSRIADAWLVIAGSLPLAASFLFFWLETDLSVYTGVVLLSVGNGLMWPSFLSILAQAGSPAIQGSIQGYSNSVGSLASIFGLILGGMLFQNLGPIVFVVSANFLFGIFLLSFRLLGAFPNAKVAPVGASS